MVVNDYFGPRVTNIPHATPNYEPDKSTVEIDYYMQTYVLQKNCLIYKEYWKNKVKR